MIPLVCHSAIVCLSHLSPDAFACPRMVSRQTFKCAVRLARHTLLGLDLDGTSSLLSLSVLRQLNRPRLEWFRFIIIRPFFIGPGRHRKHRFSKNSRAFFLFSFVFQCFLRFSIFTHTENAKKVLFVSQTCAQNVLCNLVSNWTLS